MGRKPARRAWRERTDGGGSATAIMRRPPVLGIAPGRGDSVEGTEGPGDAPGRRRLGWVLVTAAELHEHWAGVIRRRQRRRSSSLHEGLTSVSSGTRPVPVSMTAG